MRRHDFGDGLIITFEIFEGQALRVLFSLHEKRVRFRTAEVEHLPEFEVRDLLFTEQVEGNGFPSLGIEVRHSFFANAFSNNRKRRSASRVLRQLGTHQSYATYRFRSGGSSLRRCSSMISVKYQGLPVSFL